MKQLMERVASEMVEDATSTLVTFIDRDAFDIKSVASPKQIVVIVTFTEGAFREYREALRAAQCPVEDPPFIPAQEGV